jgi:isoleucyl-tRNA synthetase
VVHAEDLNFSEKGLMEVSRRILARLGNVLTFLETYGDLDTEPEALMSQHVLDQWLVARLAQVTQSVSLNLDRYELDRATRELDDFIDDLSNWYVRRSRDRFKSEDQTDRTAANQTLCWTLLELAKLLAPFAPFMAEELYQKLAGSNKLNSVHLAPWPVVSNFDQVIIADMKLARDLVTIGLELRAKAGIKVRQPLASFTLSDQEKLSNQALLALIADELNVKTIKTDGSELALETTLNPDLVAEGLSRELIRLIQDGRKQAGLNPGDLAELNLYLQGSLVSVWDQFADDIKKATNLSMVNLQTQALGEIIKIDQSEVSFELKKLG